MTWQQADRLTYEDFLEKHKSVFIFFIFCFLILSARLFFLQVIKGKYYANISDRQHTNILLEKAPRGDIYDASGGLMVKNDVRYAAFYYPFESGEASRKESIEKVEEILGRKVKVSLSGGKKVENIADNLSRDEFFRLQEKRLIIPSVAVLEETKRVSSSPEATAHIVGYLSEITASELAKYGEYKLGDILGRGGLEEKYDSDLRGTDGGWVLEVDASGRQTKVLKHIVSQKGNSLYSTIDSGLQLISAEALKNSSTGKGAVVIIDPRTGAVRSLVSAPAFNPDVTSSEEFKQYLINKDLPLYNRAVQALYPPGSIYKIITFIAAVSEKTVELDQKYVCRGSFTLGNKVFKCWKEEGHGKVSLLDAMEQSCNVYFYNIGLKTGLNNLVKYSREFRLNEFTGIDLPFEKKGSIPDAQDTKQSRKNNEWQKGDTVNVAIGQGTVVVTPVQMAVLIAAVANGGTIYEPYLAQKIVDANSKTVFNREPKIIKNVELEENTWKLLKEALSGVVEKGTGRGCYFPEFKVAGKTGTAQNPHGEAHAWFVSYAPLEEPEIAVVVIVENGGSGGSAAVPVARQIYEKYILMKQEKKDSGNES